MNWTFDKPTKPGVYLREISENEVWVSRIAKKGKLYVNCGCPVEDCYGPWFGPIPNPPKRKTSK